MFKLKEQGTEPTNTLVRHNFGTEMANEGMLSDRCGHKSMIVIGMWMQPAGILLVAATPTLASSQARNFFLWIVQLTLGSACD